MALRIDGTTESLRRTANLPSTYTFCGWSRRRSFSSVYSSIFGYATATSNPDTAIEVAWSSAGQIHCNSYGGASDSFTPTRNYTNGVPFFWAVTGNSAGGTDNITFYVRGAHELSLESGTLTQGSFTPAVATFGNNGWGEGADHDQWNIKAWDRILTAQELLKESRFEYVVDKRDLNFFWHLKNSGDLVDYGIRGRNPTPSGTFTDAAERVRLLRRSRPARPLNATAASGAITGTAAITITPTGTLTGAGALAGTAALVFGAGSSTLTGAGALAGTAALVFGGTNTLTGTGALAGSSDLVLGATGTLTGSGALAGTSDVVFTPTGTLVGAGALAGTSALVFDATLARAGDVAGTTDITITPTGTLTGAGALAGTAALAFSNSGTLDVPSGSITGTAALSFSNTGALTGAGALAGAAELAFFASLESPAQAATAQGGAGNAGKARRRPILVEIDDEIFEVSSEAQAISLLEQARDEARKHADLVIDRAKKAQKRPSRKVIADARKALVLPEIKADTTIADIAASISKEIEEMYKSAMVTVEIGALLKKQEDDDDEEVLWMLL